MNFFKRLAQVGSAVLSLGISAAVAQNSSVSEGGLDAQLMALVRQNSLSGDARDGRKLPIPSINDPMVLLGKMLFYSKAMSPGNDVACATCHHPKLGFGDGLPLPIGVGAADTDALGPGRVRAAKPGLFPPFGKGDSPMPRNSPTLVGLAFWDQSITWDGTVFSETGTPGMSGVDGRIIAPVDTPPVRGLFTNFMVPRQDLVNYSAKFDEGMPISAGHGMFPVAVNGAMRGPAFGAKGSPTTPGMTDLEVRQAIAARIGNYGTGSGALPKNDWLPYFRSAFRDHTSPVERLITANKISIAIAAFESTMTFTNTPWRDYVKGNLSAIDDSAKRGAIIFYTPTNHGGGGCSSCHRGDFFTDEKYYPLAVPQIGRGKTDINNLDDGIDDWGRAHVTGHRADKYDFRTPTLLGVELTGPYGHSGVFNTLEEIIRHHLNVEGSLRQFNYDRISTAGGPINANFATDHTNNALQKLLDLRSAGSPRAIRNVDLPNSSIADLIAFLKSLTDPCLKSDECLASWAPRVTDPDPDGLRLCAKDKNGQELLPGSCSRSGPSARKH